MKNFTTFISESPEDLSEAPGKYNKRGDKELYQWGDINQALMSTGTRPPQILNVLTKLSKKEVGIHEEVEEEVEQIEENKLLKVDTLSSAEYQKAKKLKGFDKDNYAWNKDQQLYHKKMEEAKAPKIKKMVIKGNEITGLKSGLTSYSAKPVENKGRLAFRVVDEFGGFETLDLKAFAKKFG